jgi:hypothetical protein
MGYWKERLQDASESRLILGATKELHVCAACFEDESLRAVVAGAISNEACSFCDSASTDGIAAPLEAVVEHISACISEYYEDPAESLPYETAEGGYQGRTLDTWEVLDEMGLEEAVAEGRDDLIRAIRESFEMGPWCEIDPFRLREHERLAYSWEKFCDFIKHGRRFFFLSGALCANNEESGDDLLDAGEILRAIAKHCLRLGLVRPLSAGTPVYRARPVTGRHFRSPLELGAPPPKYALQANRMSPPGIVMTYLAEEKRTALRETARRGQRRYTVGEFTLTRELRVLDLTAVPSLPSVFDLRKAPLRDAIRFLHDFTDDFSKPIAHDDRIHVDYIPSQVVTEYIRVAPELRKAGVQGLRYTSSRRNAGTCLVLFGGRELLELSQAEQAALELEERESARNQAPCLRLQRARRIVFLRRARRKTRPGH